MMHDREKSHSAILAAKPTNKAGSVSAAEPVEPRAGTKRSAGEQSTHRTEGRVRVTQVLDRVRQAARQMCDLPSLLEVRTGCLSRNSASASASDHRLCHAAGLISTWKPRLGMRLASLAAVRIGLRRAK